MLERKDYKIAIFDLDNTLYDWFGYFVKANFAKYESVCTILNIDLEKLLAEIKEINVRFEDTEHDTSLFEADSVKNHPMLSGKSKFEVVEYLKPAFDAYLKVKQENLFLYSGAREILTSLHNKGVTIIGYTDAPLHAVVDRADYLEMDQFFTRIYCRGDEHTPEQLKEKYPHFNTDIISIIPRGQSKPNPLVFERICEELMIDRQDVFYIGDSKHRDVRMANNAGVTSVLAEYGTKFDYSLLAPLNKINSWSASKSTAEVAGLNDPKIMPHFTASESIEEIRDCIGPLTPRNKAITPSYDDSQEVVHRDKTQRTNTYNTAPVNKL